MKYLFLLICNQHQISNFLTNSMHYAELYRIFTKFLRVMVFFSVKNEETINFEFLNFVFRLGRVTHVI